MKTTKQIITGVALYFLVYWVLPVGIELYLVWQIISEILGHAAQHVPHAQTITVVSPEGEMVLFTGGGTFIVHRHVYLPAKRFVNQKILGKK